MCNGGFTLVAGSRCRLVHYWLGPGCCDDLENCIENMARALRRFPLRTPPPQPPNAKWTKAGPAVDYYMVNNINQCLFHITEMAMAPFKMDKGAAPRTEDDEESRPHADMDFK